MSRSKRNRKPASTARLIEAVRGQATLDSFQNVLTRQGWGLPNLMEGTNYVLTRLTKDYNLMNALYRNSWLARRIIDIIPKDAMKNWIEYTTDLPPEGMHLIDRVIRQTRLKKSLSKGLKWGRLYGGAAGLMLIEGQEEHLEEPLDLDTILPGDFKGLMIVDRWSGVYPQLNLISDISNPEFGLPEFYQFQDYTTKIVYKIHHSRIIRFEGDDLPEWERQAETYWGASKIESVYEELKKRDNTSANIAGIIFQANLKILKMEDLGELLSGTNQKAQQDLFQVIQAQTWLMNNFSMYIMSKEDDFTNMNCKFEGLNDIYESFMMDVSGATQIPMTKLFGRSPAGLNATGESDMQNYDEVISQEQEDRLRPALEKLFPIILQSTFGTMIDEFDFIFNPIRTPNDKDLADIIDKKTGAIFTAHGQGLLTDQIGMKELKQIGEPIGLFTNITDDDINKASNEIVKLELDPEGEPVEDNESPEEE